MKAGLAATVLGIAALGAGAAPAAAQSGGATFYGGGGQAEFERAVGERGLAVDSAEDFEDARPGRGLLGLRTGAPTGPIDDPLDTDTSHDFFRPGQIPAALAFQSNRDNTGTGGPAPVGSRGLAIGRPSSAGTHATPTTISSPFTQEGPVSTDVLSIDAAHEAYVLDVSLVEFSFVEPGQDPVGGPLTVQAFDEGGAPLGSTVVDAEEIGPFLGVVAPAGSEIGRINVSEPGGSELIHSAVAYDADGGQDTGNGPAAADPVGDLLKSLGLG
jgi:hypothetical protein